MRTYAPTHTRTYRRLVEGSTINGTTLLSTDYLNHFNEFVMLLDLIPDMPDHLAVYLAAYSYFDEVERTGVKFYRYTDGFLHQKAMLIDAVAASVGTANFDNRSFRLNFEITATIGDSAFVSEVEQMFERDFARSRQMEPGELDQKSFWFRLGVKLARLTAPIQ